MKRVSRAAIRMQTKNKPIHEIRLGAIKAAVWKNDTENGGVRYNANLQRIYKDGEEWKHTDYFGRDDLLLVAKVADLTHTWICEQVQERAQDKDPSAGGPPGRWRQPSGPPK
jgi:hypothetical protein